MIYFFLFRIVSNSYDMQIIDTIMSKHGRHGRQHVATVRTQFLL